MCLNPHFTQLRRLCNNCKTGLVPVLPATTQHVFLLAPCVLSPFTCSISFERFYPGSPCVFLHVLPTYPRVFFTFPRGGAREMASNESTRPPPTIVTPLFPSSIGLVWRKFYTSKRCQFKVCSHHPLYYCIMFTRSSLFYFLWHPYIPHFFNSKNVCTTVYLPRHQNLRDNKRATAFIGVCVRPRSIPRDTKHRRNRILSMHSRQRHRRCLPP